MKARNQARRSNSQEPADITLVRQSYQPSKAEMEKPLEFPEGTTPDDLAAAVMRPVRINWKSRP